MEQRPQLSNCQISSSLKFSLQLGISYILQTLSFVFFTFVGHKKWFSYIVLCVTSIYSFPSLSHTLLTLLSYTHKKAQDTRLTLIALDLVYGAGISLHTESFPLYSV